MKIHWLYLFAALILLSPPLPYSAGLQRSILKFRSLPSAFAALRLWQNWVDLARAGLGVYLLTVLAIKVDVREPGAEFEALGIEALLLGLTILVQCVRILRTVQVLAPVFYLSGLTLTMGGDYLQGSFAVVVGWLFAIGGKNLNYQLPAMAAALAAAGYVLGLDNHLYLNCALIFLPFVLSIVFRKRLLFAAASGTAG
jgi:hypothetical protein